MGLAAFEGTCGVVLGRGSVTIVDARPMLADRRGGVHLHLLRSGDAYDLATGIPAFRAALQSACGNGQKSGVAECVSLDSPTPQFGSRE
jgi:hypothetical protein